MQIKWMENSSFLIKTSNGRRILIDPIKVYSPLNDNDLKADIITFSHTHNNDVMKSYINKESTIINSDAEFSNDYLSVKGYKTFKDDFNGYKRGENIIYKFEFDNLKICHLGLLSHKLDLSLSNKLLNLDFLFIPIGGHFCLDGLSAAKLALTLNPKYIIPMAYKTSSSYFYLDGPRKFLSNMKNVSTIKSDTILTESLTFNDKNCVLILNI